MMKTKTKVCTRETPPLPPSVSWPPSLPKFRCCRARYCQFYFAHLAPERMTNVPSVWLIIHPNDGKQHAPSHTKIPNILPRFLLTFLTRWWGLKWVICRDGDRSASLTFFYRRGECFRTKGRSKKKKSGFTHLLTK